MELDRREPTRGDWSTRKKDQARRGVYQPRKGLWAIRFTCGAGCPNPHKELIGPVKTEAIRAYHSRKRLAHDQPGWCPREERRKARVLAQERRASEAQRITFAQYADEYLAWCQQVDAKGQVRMRSWRTIKAEMSRLRPAFGSKILSEIKKEDVEAFIEDILPTVSQATTNRYLARLSAMFKRAIPSLATANPVKGIKKFKESGERDVCLTVLQERAIRDALSLEMRPYFIFALHTGLRWSKQMGLRWLDVDMLMKAITVGKDKNGRPLRVPFNSTAEAVLLEIGMQRIRPNDPHEPVFARRYREPDKFFPRAVKRAQEALREAGHHNEAARLDGVSWHGATRHTWASRLTMNGVDPRTLQTLGGWRSLAMVERYSHLSPAHLRAALEKLVSPVAAHLEATPAPELDSNLTRLHDGASRAV